MSAVWERLTYNGLISLSLIEKLLNYEKLKLRYRQLDCFFSNFIIYLVRFLNQ